MIKTLWIVSILLTSSVNANMFQALKDAAAKAVEAQKNLNNSSEYSSVDKMNTSSDQELINKIVSRIQRLRASEASFYQKYLVKQNDTPDIINAKLRNKDNMQKDFTALDTERENLSDIIGRNRLDSDLNEYFKEKGWNSNELNTIFTNASQGYPDGYILECHYFEPYIDVDSYSLHRSYDQYLKCASLTYKTRQDDAKDAKAYQFRQAQEQQEKVKSQKELEIQVAQEKQKQQIQLANEQKERQRVQGACQAWRSKTNKQVYSLGVGDQIVSKNGIIFIIRGVEANTFLVQWGGNYVYLQKSECIPYLSINSAPSPYCYK